MTLNDPAELSSTVRGVTRSDTLELSQVLARAFADDAIVQHVLPDDRSRRPSLERTYRLYFKVFLRQGACYTTGEQAGAALWLPPGKYPLTASQHLALLPGMWHALGSRRLPNALRVLGYLETLHPAGRKFWYLGLVGVEPSRQKSGLGSALMQPVIGICDDTGVGAYLETGTESNLAFYARHGFSTLQESRIPDGPRVWCLWRDPV